MSTGGLAVAGAIAAAAGLSALPAQAQLLNQYFPNGVPGYDDGLGVTVTTRQRPDYDFPGYRLGELTIRPQVAESLGYNDNLFGTKHGVGSFFAETQASLLSEFASSRGGATVSASVDDYRYFSQPSQNETNGIISLGGYYDIGRDRASLAYNFINLHQNPGDIATGGFDRPINIFVNRVLADYQINFNRLSVTPGVSFTTFRLDNTTAQGVPVIETYRNRDVVEGSVLARYELAPLENLVVVGRASNTHYVSPVPGFLAPDSNGYTLLAGIDFTPSSLWHYRALIGYELRTYNGNQVSNHGSPVAEASATFAPTGLTTFSGIFSRTIEDAAQADTVGYTYTIARLRA